MARANLFGRGVFAELIVIRALDVFLGHLDARREIRRVDAYVLDFPPVRYAVLLFVLVVVRGDIGVARIHLRFEVIGEHGDDIERHFLVAALVFTLEVGVRHRHPLGQPGAELVEHQAFPHRLFEVGRRHRRVLLRKERAIPVLTNKLPVLLQAGNRDDLRADFRIAHRNAGALRLGQLRFLLNHLLQNLLRHLHLLKDVVGQISAIRRAVGLHLGHVAPSKISHRNRSRIDGGQAIAGQPMPWSMPVYLQECKARQR